jgi:hypothetical protein
MRFTFCAVLALLTVGVGFGQEARIMILDKSDSDHLSSAYQNYLAAKKTWEQTKTYVAEKYTVDAVKPEIVKDGKTAKNYKDGWDKVQFSADFRALVPDQSQYATHYPCSYNTGYLTTSPSTGVMWTPATSTWSSGAPITGSSTTSGGTLSLNSNSLAVSPEDIPPDSGVTINGDLRVNEPVVHGSAKR